MKIVADENIPLVEELFSAFGTVEKKDGRGLQKKDLAAADVLLVRSVTRVDRTLLEGTPVAFVGTATIGEDHIDKAWLREQGIQFVSAPGCNAVAVVQYVMACLLELERTRSLCLEDATVGIVGCGNVGSRLRDVLHRLNIRTLVCDPPLKAAGIQGLVELEALYKADVVSFHVPLILDGSDPTWHLADCEFLASLKPGAVVINTSRGPVVSNTALSRILDSRSDLAVVLDVWEGEPVIDPLLANKVDIATPHIAGYSYDGKISGTRMLYEGLCRFLQQRPGRSVYDYVPDEYNLCVDLSCAGKTRTVLDIVRKVYSVMDDDVALRCVLKMPAQERGKAFDLLRKDYRIRREFQSVRFRNEAALQHELGVWQWAYLNALGFGP